MKTKSISFPKRNEARFSFAVLLCAALVLPSVNASAEWNPAAESPYSFGPEGRPIGDIMTFAKPNQMVDFLPNRPIAARDKYGNRVYYSGDGHLTVSIARDGSMSFSMKGMTIQKDANGNLVSTSQNVKGTNKVEIRNEKGEILGYQTLGFNDKVLQEFDAQGNLTKTNTYDAYGKVIQNAVDELSLTKTEFDKNGNPVCDRDFEGAVVARYSLDESNRVQSKKDVYGNVTHFGKDGNMTYTDNHKGEKISEYHYATDAEGRNILDYIENVTPGEYSGDKTYFQNGKAAYTLSRFGGVAREYHYDGTTLVYTFDTRTNETTWYDINGKSVCNTFNEYKTKEWIYYKSRLVGYFDDSQKTVTLFQYERQDQTVKVLAAEDKPTAEDIESYFESRGLMAAIGTPEIDPNSGRKASARFTNIVSAQKAPLQKTDFSTVSDAPVAVVPERTGLLETKYTYSAGMLESVLVRDPQDPSGYATQVFVGAVTSGQDTRTSIMLTGDQRTNIALVNSLWSTIIDGNQNISDISAGNGDLAGIAKSIKSININANELAKLSDSQICNLFGWNLGASNTRSTLEDVGARAEHAGADGTIAITFGFDNEGAGTHIYAAMISAVDVNRFTVGGTQQDRVLDLTTEAGRSGVVTPAGAAQGPALVRNQASRQAASTALEQTVNGITRTYAQNGVVLSETDSLNGTRTTYDNTGRITATYRSDGTLDRSYTYARNGTLESMKALGTDSAGQPAYTTTFFVGWGAATKDQPSITVAGDQTGNAALAAKLWTAINNGASISDIASGTQYPELSSLAKSISTISINANAVIRASDQQLKALLGISSVDDVKTWARDTGADGTFVISYRGDTISAHQIEIDRGSTQVAVMTLQAPPLETAVNSVQQDTGISFLANAAVSAANALLGR